MIDLIVIIIIIYVIFKKSTNFNTKVPALLKLHKFQNIRLLRSMSYCTFYTAQKAGDNYLIQAMIVGNHVTQSTISDLVNLAQKNHYHNMIIIPNSSIISDIAKKEIKSNAIQILKSDEKVSSDESAMKASFIQKLPLDDNCPIDEPQEAIQDGKKANSIFGNFFGNKIERL